MRFEVEMTDLQEKIKRIFEINATFNPKHVIDRSIKETDGKLYLERE